MRTHPLALITRTLLAAGLLAAPAATQDKPLYLDPTAALDKRLDDLLPRLSLDEKLALIRANGKFRSGGVPRLGIPYLWTADGPQGVREELGLDSWESAKRTDDFVTAMPVGMALASSWDPELAKLYGKVIGEEARARDKHVMLGPALNIQRTPLCGRTYDYFGEDPWLSGRMTVGYVQGMQNEQVAACIKHFALNNQETNRHAINVEADERTLREIYLPAFEAGVKEGGALSVMAAYNKFRGQHAGHHDYLLNQILKNEWGFKGSVISDWSGTHDTREAALNGLDLEMGTVRPYENYYLARAYKEGLLRGEYPMSTLDDKARRNLRVLFTTGAVEGRKPGFINTPAHLDAARQVAQDGIVLLKNAGGLLPIDLTKIKSIAVIGENAVRTFAAGGNAAGVKAFREVDMLQGIVKRVGSAADITYATGYRQPVRRNFWERDGAGVRRSELDPKYLAEAAGLADRAVAAAKTADLVIFVGGLTHQAFADDEGVDRRDLSLPSGQDALIARIVEANPRTVVALISGGPVLMPWLDKAPAVLQAWYGGSEAGTALARVLFGDANPSGKLPCTFPKALADIPAHQGGARTFPGENGTVHYDEGLLVGYRWFDTKHVEPLFPFGFGLSYTSFAYGPLTVTPGSSALEPTLALDITNSGQREGAEVVQLYVRAKKARVMRPEKELKGFAKVLLKPGETRRVNLKLDGRSFAYYAPEAKAWRVDAGEYELLVGTSSRDIRQAGSFKVVKPAVLPK